MIFVVGIVLGQTWTFETDKPDLTIPKPHYEYVIFWRTWDSSIYSMAGMEINTKYPNWDYHSQGYENLEGLLKWLNSTNWYGDQKRIRLNDNQIIAVYDLTRAKKIKLQIVKTEMVKSYKVETKEKKWIDVQWRIK